MCYSIELVLASFKYLLALTIHSSEDDQPFILKSEMQSEKS